MIRIAYCDDRRDALEELKRHLDRFMDENRALEITCDAFESATELLSRISAGAFYDLIFLDIVMPVISGIDAAQEIYANNKVTQFVFLTTSKEFAVDAYAVEALDYLVKPIDAAGFRRAMQRFFAKGRNMETEELLVTERSGFAKVPLHMLCYVEVYDHYLFYHLADGSTLKSREKLSVLEEKLCGNNRFVKPHRSYIVNMEYVQRIDPTSLGLRNGSNIPISKANYKAVADAFLKYRFEKGAR